MHPILSFVLQFVLVLVPVWAFWLLQRRNLARPSRLLLSAGLALLTGLAAFALKAGLDWTPTTRSGRALSVSAEGLFLAFALGMLVIFLLMEFWPKRTAR